MKILIPILGFGKSGGNRVLSKLADELILLVNDLTFLCPDCSEFSYFPTKANIIWANKLGKVNGPNLNWKKKATFLGIQFKLWITLLRLPAKVFDFYIANHSLKTYPLEFSALGGKTLYYVQAYEPDYFELLPGTKNKILKLFSELSYKMNLFTVVNAEKYLHYKKIDSQRFLYPGVDFSIFHPTPNIKEDKQIIIGIVGRKEHFKGTQYIVEALKQLKIKFSNIKLVVALGDPNDFQDDHDLLCEIPNNDEELAMFYQGLDYNVCGMYSQLNTFHYPVVETLSCGIPLITTSFYLANEENSWIIRKKNAQDIIDQFAEIQSDPKNKEDKFSKALSDVKEFNWKNAGKKMSNYLNELLILSDTSKP